MSNKRVNLKQVVRISGAFVAFLIGSGFATGQEVIQYFAAYGYRGIAGIMVMFCLFMYTGVSFITAGYEYKNLREYNIYIYYCGMHIGRFYNLFTIVFAYMSVIVMISGAGATLNEQYSLPVFIGCIIMALLSCCTVILGLNKIVDIIGKIGPVIVILSIFLGLSSIVKNPIGLQNADKIIPNLKLMKSSSNWFFSACLYVGFSILWLATFLSSMGARANSKKEASLGVIGGVTAFSLAVLSIALGLLANIELVEGTMIPSLILAKNINERFADIFSLTVVLGIYTTAVPLLWSVSSRISHEKSYKFSITTIILAIVATLIGLTFPFDFLVNLIYGINGYIGLLFLLLMIIKGIKNKFN
ncbi:putative membrane protein YkvI [Sedimentibacter acidaminivorans]|uniref:Membrane protein YkvI n=1 Tax=Sedimentibacter acidaminivorans TaxID=913099 RepID=A0ABS4GGK9_9FIRM|nr:hypothetical protein [Sedimentibacter acidaminivorans]MBP1926784.1 putative membrane protein YkvI [Sedimentibacter acidaminivorans]